MVNFNLIEKFRERVHFQDYVFNAYRAKWGCICSAMDWISVAVSYLEKHRYPKIMKNDNLSCANIATYIICIDMIYQAVTQLHRVFISNEGNIFQNHKQIFRNNKYHKDDSDYFKLIRACVAAHPVNLNDYFLSGTTEARYASWPFNLSSKTCSIYLYSNDTKKEHIQLDIDFDETNVFLEYAYNHLNTLINAINKNEIEHNDKYINKQIEKSTDPYIQLCILESENKMRFQNEYYNDIISLLKLIFSIELSDNRNNVLLSEFRKENLNAVDELYICLQDMKLTDIETYEKTRSVMSQIQHSISNGLQELYKNALDDNEKSGIWNHSITKYLENSIIITGEESDKELYVLSFIGVYKKLKNTK